MMAKTAALTERTAMTGFRAVMFLVFLSLSVLVGSKTGAALALGKGQLLWFGLWLVVIIIYVGVEYVIYVFSSGNDA